MPAKFFSQNLATHALSKSRATRPKSTVPASQLRLGQPKTLNPLHFPPTLTIIDIRVTRNPAAATSHPRRLRRADVPPALPARLSRAILLRRHAPSGRPPASAPPPVT